MKVYLVQHTLAKNKDESNNFSIEWILTADII